MQDLIEKADVLIEALPYIQQFRGKLVVVKYGGSTMETHAPESVLRDIVFMECVGMRPVLIHGGGGAINKRLRENGISPRFVDGLRVSDEKTIGIVKEVLHDVNRRIVQKLEEMGGKAKGLSARDRIILCRKHVIKKEKGGFTEKIDIGFVGDVTKIRTQPLRELCRKDVVPVIAPLGVDEEGRIYNINADTVAGEVAAALKSRKLVLLTDVHGILREPGNENSLIGTLRVRDIAGLAGGGVIKEGMLPKIKAAVKSVSAGVHKTHIIDGRVPHSLLLEIFTDRGIGTEIVAD